MLLRSLRLKNIRSYLDVSLVFPKGPVLIFGDIGSGKSTILLSIEFALFGLLKGDVSGSTLLRHGANEGSVELGFDIDGRNVVIVRRLKRKNNSILQDSGQIIIDNILTECTPIELKSKVLELLGYPQDMVSKNTSLIYRYTIYTPQEDMKTILFAPKDLRLDTLRKIFNIEKYKTIRENALEYGRELRSRKKILESKVQDLEPLKDELTRKIEELKILGEECRALDLDYEALAKELTQLRLELKSLESESITLARLKNEYIMAQMQLKTKSADIERYGKELNIITYRINEYNAKLKEFGDIDANEESLRANVETAEQNLLKIKSSKELISQRLRQREDDLKAPIDDIIILESSRDSINSRLAAKNDKEIELEKLTKENDSVNIELSRIRALMNASKSIINRIKDLNTCPTCLSELSLSHKTKINDTENANIILQERNIKSLEYKQAGLRDNISLLKSDIAQLRNDEIEIAKLSTKISAIKQKMIDRSKIVEEVKLLREKKEKLDSMDVSKLMEIISKNRKILNSILALKHIQESLKEKELQKTEREKALHTLSDEEQLLKSKLEELSSTLEKFSELEKSLSNKKEALESKDKEVQGVALKLTALKKDKEFKDKEVKTREAAILEKEQIKEQAAYIGDLNYWMTEHFINLTNIMERKIMQAVHTEFRSLFRKWTDIIIDEENLEIDIDAEFSPLIRQNGYDTDIENLSGGEKTAVALAYRLALNKVINDLISTIKTKDILILDEPTDGFSSEQLDKMREVLLELDAKQMLIVSHESKIESYVESVMHVHKNNHNSKIFNTA
jgi:exonuclease SbcC